MSGGGATSLHVDPALLTRWGGAGPRYTSYPTVPEWSAEFGEAGQRSALARASERADEPLALYVHVPFCASLCLYCGCTVQITRRADIVERYLDSLEREIAAVAGLLGRRRGTAQLHWGGGTPTHLSSAQIRRLFGALDRHFQFLPGAELSIEVHPHVTRAEQIDTLAELGFNRVSMGVQDLDPRVQEVVNRHQTTAETEALIAHCRARGVAGINVDLMYGLPEQTEATFAHTLDQIARWQPSRLAVYGYAHVPWLKPFQKSLERHALPDAALRTRLFCQAVDRLGASGYEVVGLDHFALRGDELFTALRAGTLHRNFMGYATSRAEDMVSFGMSAISEVAGSFYQNEHTTAAYQARIESGRLAAQRGLARTPEDELRRAAILELMCRMELDLDRLEARFPGRDLQRHFQTEWARLAPLAADELVQIGPRRVRVTELGRLFLRPVAMCFDEYLTRPRGSAPRFSKTV
jgi:oxygen-independent coproporphyrinogen-3 oxidase